MAKRKWMMVCEGGRWQGFTWNPRQGRLQWQRNRVVRLLGMVLCGLILVAGVLGTGCSSSNAEAVPAPATPSTMSASTGPPGPEVAATSPAANTSQLVQGTTGDIINDSYVYFWAGFMEAQATGNPDLPELTRYASGQALAAAREFVRVYREQGWVRVIKNGYRLDSRVVARQATTARVSDVQDWSKWPLVIGNSEDVVPGSTPRQCITAGLVLRDGAWIVDTLTFAPNTC